jgi:hypothetical protein
MINLTERSTSIGEITCSYDVRKGDYSLSLDGAITQLLEENERLQDLIDKLSYEIECLCSGTDLRTLGSA